MQGSDVYLERLLPGQLLCWGGAVLLNTIKHPGLRLEEREEKTVSEDAEKTCNYFCRDFSCRQVAKNKQNFEHINSEDSFKQTFVIISWEIMVRPH